MESITSSPRAKPNMDATSKYHNIYLIVQCNKRDSEFAPVPTALFRGPVQLIRTLNAERLDATGAIS